MEYVPIDRFSMRMLRPHNRNMSREVLLTVVVFNSLVLFIPVAMFLLYKRPHLWQYLFGGFLGLLIGWIDIRAIEVQPTVLLLVVFGLFLGFAQPRHAWRWALILGIWIPLGGFATVWLGLKAFSVQETIGSTMAFIPALVGAYGGVLVNRAAARSTAWRGAAD